MAMNQLQVALLLRQSGYRGCHLDVLRASRKVETHWLDPTKSPSTRSCPPEGADRPPGTGQRPHRRILGVTPL